MHKISDEFRFRSDQTTDYGVSCPWVSKKFPIDLQWENGVCMLAHSFLIKSSSKLLVTRTGIKARMSLISGLWFPWPIYMFLKWDLTLARWTQVSDRCPLGYLFIKSSSKLLVTRTGIKARTSLISGRIRLLTLELLALEWRKFYTSELGISLRPVANLDQILCVASLGVGKGCIMFWGKLEQNSCVHGNRKPPLTYNGENGVSTFSRLLLIGCFLYLQVTRTCIKSQTSSNFGQIGPLTTELAALERLKKFSYRPIMGKWCLHASSFILDQIIFKVPGNHQDRHKSSVEFDFGPNQTAQYGVTCPWVTKTAHFWTLISPKPVGQSWSNFMCSIIGVGERLHKVLGQIDLGTLD